MTNLNENKTLPTTRDFSEEVLAAFTGAWFQTKRTGADVVVLGAESTEASLKLTATVVEGGIILVRGLKEVLPEDIDELVADANAFFTGTKDAAATVMPKASTEEPTK